ncbi:MAG TPA: alpha/beta hydrolase, partial [Candidatus Baltobacteraceae bacterium]|nr:alpha/beta hydrolase [Candidatus Baltobacteraceae bacterium]
DLVDPLIVIEATSHSDGGDEPWLSRWPLPFPDLDAARAFFESQTVNADVWIDVLEKCDDGYRPEFSAADMRAAAADIESGYDYRREWQSIRCPTLLVGGDRSPIYHEPMKEMASVIPCASYVCVAAAGHDLHLDNPAALRFVVNTFLKH